MTYPVERLLYSMQHPSSIGTKRLQEMAKRMVSNIEPEHKVDESTYTTQNEARRLMTNIVQKHRQLCNSSAIDYNHMLDTIRSLRGVQWSSIENECLRMKKEVEDAEIRYKRKTCRPGGTIVTTFLQTPTSFPPNKPNRPESSMCMNERTIWRRT